MIQYAEYIYHQMPEKVKIAADVAAGVTGLSALFGVMASVMGALASLAAFVYTVMRIYFYLKDRKAGKR